MEKLKLEQYMTRPKVIEDVLDVKEAESQRYLDS